MLNASTTSTGLPNLNWATYQIDIPNTGSSATSLAPPSIAITSYVTASGSVVFTASAGILWARVGQVVNVSGFTLTDAGMNLKSYVITAIDYSAKTITATIPINPDNYGANTSAVTRNSPSGSPVINIIAMAQQMQFKIVSGTSIAIYPDSASCANAYGYFFLVASVTVPVVVTNPVNFKTNLADLYAVASGGTVTLLVGFV